MRPRPTGPAASFHSRVRRRTAIISAAVVLAVLTAVVISSLRDTTVARLPARLTIHLPDSPIFSSVPSAQMSPDGRQVAFWVDGGGSHLAPQSECSVSGIHPRVPRAHTRCFWSPDSQRLGFTTASAVKKLTISNRTVETLLRGLQASVGRYVEPE